MAEVHAIQTKPGTARASWRVGFTYRDDDIRPVSARRVVMVAPGGVAPSKHSEDGCSGAWMELLDERGRRWARSISQPNRADREAYLGDGNFTRVKREIVEGEFELIIPDLGPDAVFVLYASPADAPEEAAVARVKLQLAELVRLEGGGSRPQDPEGKPQDPKGKPQYPKGKTAASDRKRPTSETSD